MANTIRFRNYSDYAVYKDAPARKLELALPKEILEIPCVKEEVKQLNLTTWQYSVDGSTREGTFYWEKDEKAWKYYGRFDMVGVLDRNGETEAADRLEDYLLDPANADDELPKFTIGKDED